jgi:hypothetical protein
MRGEEVAALHNHGEVALLYGIIDLGVNYTLLLDHSHDLSLRGRLLTFVLEFCSKNKA